MKKVQYGRTIGVDRSYNFKDKDPIIDIMRSAIAEHEIPLIKISEGSGVSRNCLENWFYGETKRPQFASLQRVARYLGMSLELTEEGHIYQSSGKSKFALTERQAKLAANKRKATRQRQPKRRGKLIVYEGGKAI